MVLRHPEHACTIAARALACCSCTWYCVVTNIQLGRLKPQARFALLWCLALHFRHASAWNAEVHRLDVLLMCQRMVLLEVKSICIFCLLPCVEQSCVLFIAVPDPLGYCVLAMMLQLNICMGAPQLCPTDIYMVVPQPQLASASCMCFWEA